MSRIIWMVAAAVLFVGCVHEGERQQKKLPIRVKTEVATMGGYANNPTYVGVVEESEATAVSFTSMGVVNRLFVTEGQFVRKGDLLAEMDNTTMSNTLEASRMSTSQAEDMVAQAQATYDQAKDAYDRMGQMYEEGTLPEIKWIEAETRLKQAETALKSAQSGVVSAKAAENIAQKGVDDMRLRAPVAGVIGHKVLGAGETALPSQAVVSILNIDLVKVRVAVPELELRSISPDMLTSISVEAAGVSLLGGKIEKGVEADPVTHTYQVRVNVANRDHALLPGMVANVVFGKENRQDEILLPVSCVQKGRSDAYFVWTVGSDSTVRRTTVSVGPTFGNRVAVYAGVANGDRVVVEGYQKLSEGLRVKY